jgi:hypothetical protein
MHCATRIHPFKLSYTRSEKFDNSKIKYRNPSANTERERGGGGYIPEKNRDRQQQGLTKSWRSGGLRPALKLTKCHTAHS